MAKDYSPFSPGTPVAPENFAGKQAELERMIESCRAAAAGRFARTFVVGDRGIGKTSLCNFVRQYADRELSMLSLHVFLGGVQTIEEMAERVFTEVARSSIERPWYAKLKGLLGQHIKEVGLFGVSVGFSAGPEELKHLAGNLPWELNALVEKLGGQRQGILLILDDLNGLAGAPAFANWLKSFIDTIATTRPVPMHLVLAGLPERRTALLKGQPSLDRAFDLLQTQPISEQEAATFFTTTFASAGVTVQPRAVELLTQYSGGYPVLMHEIGDAVFKGNNDTLVDMPDAFQGVLAAAEVVGQKYLDANVLDAIRSERYRSILSKLAGKLNADVILRQHVAAALSPEEIRVFDNFVKKMKDLGVLETVREGEYRFSNRLHRLYYMMAATPKPAAGKDHER